MNASRPPAEAPIPTTGNETEFAFTDSLSAFWPRAGMRVGSDLNGVEVFLAGGLFFDLGLFSLTITGISATGVAIEGNSSEGIATGLTGTSFLQLRHYLAPIRLAQASQALRLQREGAMRVGIRRQPAYHAQVEVRSSKFNCAYADGDESERVLAACHETAKEAVLNENVTSAITVLLFLSDRLPCLLLVHR